MQSQPQQPGMQHPGVNEFIYTPAVRQGFAYKPVRALSICQIIFGANAIILGSAGTGVGSDIYHFVAGLWCGVLLIVTGYYGVVTSVKKTNNRIIATMVLSIISASLSGTALCVSGAIFSSYSSGCNWRSYPTICRNMVGLTAINSLLSITGLATIVISIITAAVCCRAVCCRQRQDFNVYYVPNQLNQTQMTSAHTLPTTTQLIPSAKAVGMRRQCNLTIRQQHMIQKRSLPKHVVTNRSRGQMQPTAGDQMYVQHLEEIICPQTTQPTSPETMHSETQSEYIEGNKPQEQPDASPILSQLNAASPSYFDEIVIVTENMKASLVDNEVQL
ncbi:uncharacterized protein LOC144432941 isoform X2 [Glandiceps talaboti]